MHDYYVYIAAALVAVVLIGLVLITARSRSRARPAPAAGPDALDVADALDAEAALKVADALDVVDAVVEAHSQARDPSQRPNRVAASRALPARARPVRALPAPAKASVTATATPPETDASPQPVAAEVVEGEVVEAEIVEAGEQIPWPAQEQEEEPPFDAPETAAEASEEPDAPRALPPDDPAAQPARVPVVGVRPDDPQVLAAATEARRQFHEFQSAFAARRAGQTFAVKAPFSHAGGREFMWVVVRSIRDGVVSGRLAREPVEVTELRRGDPVTASVEDVADWLFRDADASAPARGAFTAEAVKAAAPHGSHES